MSASSPAAEHTEPHEELPAEVPQDKPVPTEGEALVAEPVGGLKRELEDAEESKAKIAKHWDESPSKAVISDCLMVWAEDKSILNGEEILV